MAEDKLTYKNNETYLYMNINLYICISLYNEMKNGNKLHQKFVDEIQEKERRENRKIKRIPHISFYEAVGVSDKHHDRNFKNNKTALVNEEEASLIADTLGVIKEYFIKEKYKIIKIPNMDIDKWKSFWNNRYMTEFYTQSNIGYEQIKLLFKDLVLKLENDECGDEITQIYKYYLTGSRVGNVRLNRIQRVIEGLRRISVEDWEELCAYNKEEMNSYVKILKVQTKIADSVNTVVSAKESIEYRV